MIVIGIDPGPKESAYIRLEDGTVTKHETLANNSILAMLGCLAYERTVVAVVIEWIVGYGLTVGSETFDTCRWVGRFEQAVDGATLLTRKAIKLNLCSNTQAKDVHVRQALIDRLGEPGTKKAPGPTYGIVGHEWAALAVAV